MSLPESRIWSLREEGEDTEDAILRRVLASVPRRKLTSARITIDRSEPPAGSAHGSVRSQVTWRDDVRLALERLNGRASLSKIYREVRAIRRASGRSMPASFEPVVRRTLEEHSSESEVFRGGPDLFYMPEGKGMDVWALR